MEPSWTEPPPLAWVLIGVRERSTCRRQSGPVALSGPERCRSIVERRQEEHVAQGHGMTWSDKVDSEQGDDHDKSSCDGGGRSAGTGPMTRNVPVPHWGQRW